MRSLHKEIRPTVEAMIRLGCRIESGSKHDKVFDPQGNFITIVSSGRPGYELVKKMKKRLKQLEESKK